MEIKIPRAACAAIGQAALAPYGMSDDTKTWGDWRKHHEVDMRNYTLASLTRLQTILAPHKAIHGMGTALKDVALWIKVAEGRGDTRRLKARTVEHFRSLVHALLERSPGHRIYQRDDERGVDFAYYVDEIQYEPETKDSRGETYPAYARLHLWWVEFSRRHEKWVTFFAENCVGVTVDEALLGKNLQPETPTLRAKYLAEKERFEANVGLIGKQFLAVGVATDDLDGNDKAERRGWWSSSVQTIRLDKNGPSRVVIDVFREGDEEDKHHERAMDRWFWRKRKVKRDVVLDEEDTTTDDEDETTEAERENPEVPLHPKFACFDLRKHRRLRIHVTQLTEYEYDTTLAEKLVLAPDNRELIEMLVQNRGGFRDIIGGKSGGSVILCAGASGLGKTLSAEVYAESMQRPLYSVQASQLGTDPDRLEDHLLKTFLRAQRWNAILLLDECDVYVSARGTDLVQNAIVGVFLRVLEYYSGVLFMTTNRADLVDDAIASRCIAKVEYDVPTEDAQARIWRILSDVSGIAISSDEIETIVLRHPRLSGRDVKNLLKLGGMICAARGCALTADVIDFAKRFKPTADES